MNVKKFAALAGLACALAASLCGATQNSYRMSFTLSRDGRPFATPALLVNSGVPAVIEVAGPDGYRLDVTVDDAGNGDVRVGMHLSTNRMSAAPVLLAKLGETISASVGKPGTGELGISFTALASGR